MKIADTRLKKSIIIAVSSLIVAMVAVLIFSSPIAKYLLVKYGEKYTGRTIKIGWVYANPFTGYIHIENLKIYESTNLPVITKGDTIFISARGVSADFALLKLFSKVVEISQITLDQPQGIFIQNKKNFNISDLIQRWKPKKPGPSRSSVHFNIRNIKINNGEFHYRDEGVPVNYFIKDGYFESKGKVWNSDILETNFSFNSGTGKGSAKGKFTINLKSLAYHFTLAFHELDLNFLDQYLKAMVNYGTFRASLEADITAAGNFHDKENLTAKGVAVFTGFHIEKNPDEDYASFDKFVIKADEFSPKNHRYLFDSLSLTHPFFKYELYDYLDNLQMMFGKKGANISAVKGDRARFNLIITITRYVRALVTNFLKSYYRINRLAVYEGDLQFNDYSISEKFSTDLSPIRITADSIDKDHDRLKVYLNTGVKPYGTLSAALSMNPRNSDDFDLQYHLQRVPVAMFNPYLITFTSFPLDRGTIETKGTWNVKGGIIQSVNHLVIIDPRITSRLKNKDKKWLPLPLIMSLVRERGNVIDYEIPITGNLKNPAFHLHDAIMDLLKNIFVKPSTTAYRMQVKNTETEIEKSFALKWDTRQGSLYPEQEKFLKTIVQFLVKNPDASIDVHPVQYADKEKEYIEFYEAKKKYILLSRGNHGKFLSEDDSLTVDKMSVKDSLFVRFLTRTVNDTMLFTIQQKCAQFIGQAIINAKFQQLSREREASFMIPFKGKAVENRVKIHPAENMIPYNGFSYFKIAYKDEFPEPLIKAYRKMNELNEEAPRKKYEKERKESKKGQ